MTIAERDLIQILLIPINALQSENINIFINGKKEDHKI